MRGTNKVLVSVCLVLGSISLCVQSANAVVSESESPIRTWQECHLMCILNTSTVCEPVHKAVEEGRIDDDTAHDLCTCVLLVCANACARNHGFVQHPYPQICDELGITDAAERLDGHGN